MITILRGIALVLIFGIGLPLLYGLIFKFEGKRPSALGVSEGKLGPAPSTPNGVSSTADPADVEHYIEGIFFTGETTGAMTKLGKIVREMPGTKIVQSEPNYLYAEFQSKLLGFVDDVEFYADGAEIQVRSASRIGRSDLGINRRRIEDIRAKFMAR